MVKIQKKTKKRKNELEKYFYSKNLKLASRPEFKGKDLTIGGFNYVNAKALTNFISISLGVIIFVAIPYIANKIQRPMTSAFLNVVPNGMILGFFIEKEKFVKYFLGLIFAPAINPVLNTCAYIMYDKYGFTPVWCLSINIVIWALMVVVAYMLNL